MAVLPQRRLCLETQLEQNADRLKALLIIIVAADHNDWFRQLMPNLFEPLTFHVLGFFLLAFSFGTKTWSVRFIADRVARYLVPYWWAMTAASLAFFLMYHGNTGLRDSLLAWVLAAVIGNAPFVKSASGLLMLWFLPSLFGLTCFMAVYTSLQSKRAKQFALLLAITAHFVIPLFPRSAMLWMPFGLAIAMAIFVLGLVWQKCLRLELPRYWGAISATVFVFSYAILVLGPIHLEIATLELVGIENPWIMLLQDISGVAGVLTALWLVGLSEKFRWIEGVGRNSLLVYLIHPIIYILLGKLWPSAPKDNLAPLVLFLHGGITIGLAVGLAYALSVVLSRSRVFSVWITPKSWKQWPPVRSLVRGTD